MKKTVAVSKSQESDAQFLCGEMKGNNMQGYNCIMIYAQDRQRLLFCKRTKNPYKGMYNFVGGKLEPGEDGFHAAYRELYEETGITDKQVQLHHMMDFTYYNQNNYVEVYVGCLKEEVTLKEEAHPLEWLDLNEDFYDVDKFAGEGNIGHMIEQVRRFGPGDSDSTRKEERT